MPDDPLRIDHDDSGVYAPDDFNGVWEVYWPNLQIKFRGAYVNGKQQGETTCWWDNGSLAQTGWKENGVCRGIWADYWPDGTKFKETEYQDNANFVVRWYSPEGEIERVETWVGGCEVDAFDV